METRDLIHEIIENCAFILLILKIKKLDLHVDSGIVEEDKNI